MEHLIDISPRVSPDIAVWPGDVPFSRDVSCDLEEGDNFTLSSITTTVHLGAHTDAPNHYAKGAAGIGSRDLRYYYGPCQVVHVDIPSGGRILPEHVTASIGAERVLFRTGSFPDLNHFAEHFNSLSPELVDWLHDQGVILVGIDTPSVDPFRDRELLSHNAIARHDMAILEGVVLEQVPEGSYTLIALPLRLEGVDASPVRAALLKA